MAYLTLATTEDKNSGFKFIGTNSATNNGGLICSTTSLITNNTSLIMAASEGGVDTCSFYSGPSDTTIFAFGESNIINGSTAYSDSESCGAIAYSNSESCGSVATSVSSGSSFSGGGCSYNC